MGHPPRRSGMRRLLSFFGGLAIAFVLVVITLQAGSKGEIKTSPAPKTHHVIAVALLISGASRGPAVLRRFAASLQHNVIQPFKQQSATIHAFVWLQDAAAEQTLCHLLVAHRDRGLDQPCITRDSALREAAQATRRVSLQPPPGSRSAADEMATVAADHPPSAYPPSAWRSDRSPNTLRMLHKWRGVEWLRLRTLAEQDATTPSSRGVAGHHDWVLRSKKRAAPALLRARRLVHASSTEAVKHEGGGRGVFVLRACAARGLGTPMIEAHSRRVRLSRGRVLRRVVTAPFSSSGPRATGAPRPP